MASVKVEEASSVIWLAGSAPGMDGDAGAVYVLGVPTPPNAQPDWKSAGPGKATEQLRRDEGGGVVVPGGGVVRGGTVGGGAVVERQVADETT